MIENTPLLTDWLNVIAASLTMVAAFSAIFIAYKAPKATKEEPAYDTRITERYYVIIERVSQSIGMSDKISDSDIRSGYYPRVLVQLNAAAIADAEEKLSKKPKNRK